MACGDETGPAGSGPMTGHQAGCCTAEENTGSADPTLHQGQGRRGRGGGHGRGGHGQRNRFHATGLTGWQRAALGLTECCCPPPGEETVLPDHTLECLNRQRKHLEGVIEDIGKRIETLEAEVES